MLFLSLHETKDLSRKQAELVIHSISNTFEKAEYAYKPRHKIAAPEAVVATTTTPPPGTAVAYAGEPVILEVEKAHAMIEPMVVLKDESASKGTFIVQKTRPEPQTEQMKSPGKGRAIYYLKVAEETTVQIWGRIKIGPGSLNSFFVGIGPGKQQGDAESLQSWVVSGTANKWAWYRHAKSFTLQPGVNSLVIATREAGTALDTLRVTPVGAPAPTTN
jgi:hypothetical protein